MNLNISGAHIDVTDALRDHVDTQFAKLEKVTDPGARIHVDIGKVTEHRKQGNIFRAEAKVIEPKAEYFATIVAEDLYVAINSLSDELFDQITRSKSKHRALLKKGRAMIKKLLRF
jgi:putative sigma-54 modulation protein